MLEKPRDAPWAIYKPAHDGKNGGMLDWRSDKLIPQGDYLLVSDDGESEIASPLLREYWLFFDVQAAATTKSSPPDYAAYLSKRR